MTQHHIEANRAGLWNTLWQREGAGSWRGTALATVYERIAQLVQRGSKVIDIGGGVGQLAAKLREDCAADVTVADHSDAAIEIANRCGIRAIFVDLEKPWGAPHPTDVMVATEVAEHLSDESRDRLFRNAHDCESAIISIPNNRLGPDEEPQHAIKWTAVDFLTALRAVWGPRCRVEVLGGYLLGVCGKLAEKGFRMSLCLPVRDEAADLGKTLASFRGVADEIIVGVDPRTVDNTREVAAEYADQVFDLESPQGPPDEWQGETGCHFSWCRNQCIERCTGDWIFMTEGHEHLGQGVDELLRLDRILSDAGMSYATVVFVLRTGQGQQWGFPWLFRNTPSIRFKRPVHNILGYPEDSACAFLAQVKTVHDRDHGRAKQRDVQRRTQNRKSLFDDWRTRGSLDSLFYYAQEWRHIDDRKAIENYERYLVESNNGVVKYGARLVIARYYMTRERDPNDAEAFRNDMEIARSQLLQCAGDDWSRTEHWLWLGDVSYNEGKLEQAYRFYRYCATTIGAPPPTLWWIDLSNYSYLPAQRLAMVCGELGRLTEALHWAEKTVDLMRSDDAPREAIDEAEQNVRIISEAINATQN